MQWLLDGQLCLQLVYAMMARQLAVSEWSLCNDGIDSLICLLEVYTIMDRVSDVSVLSLCNDG